MLLALKTRLLPAKPVAAEPMVPTLAAAVALPLALARAMERVALASIGAVVALQALIRWRPDDFFFEPSYYFVHQDKWWVLLIAVVLLALSRLTPAALPRLSLDGVLERPERAAAILALLVFVASLASTYGVAQNYDLVRDEQMASFDTTVFMRGHLMAVVPPEWRDYAAALQPRFMVQVAGNTALGSSYLPGNAAFRALVATLLAPQFANPLLAALSVWLCFGLARVLWPARPDAAIVASLLLATSAQVLFMASTSFAMTGHMALTLAWLRLYLRGGALGAAGALAVGFVAMGWHQLAFHVFFAAPFVLHLWWGRRFRTALVYSFSYLAFAVFWTGYWSVLAAAAGVHLGGGFEGGSRFFFERFASLLGKFTLFDVATVALNLVRMLAWNNPILPALLVIAFACRRGLPLPLRLSMGGVVATLLVVLFVLPSQGHGWGYRYLHGYLGVLCLIGAYGWMEAFKPVAASDAATGRSRSMAPIAAICAFTLLVLLPAQASQVHTFINHHKGTYAAIAKARADIVIVDDRHLFYGEDFGRNDPFLRNKPLFLTLDRLEPALIDRLCARGLTVSFFDRTEGVALGALKIHDEALPDWRDGRRAHLLAVPCLVPLGVR